MPRVAPGPFSPRDIGRTVDGPQGSAATGKGDRRGRVTYAPANWSEAIRVGGFRTLRQVAYAGSFEGVTLFKVGVRAHLPYRVLVVAGPGGHSRLVLDAAHRW